MPLDTAPLSTTRRLIAVVVLLAMFAGSMGVAGMIVTSRKGRPDPVDPLAVYRDGVKIEFPTPVGFLGAHWDEGGNPDDWDVATLRGQWEMARMDGKMKTPPESRLHEELERLARQEMGEAYKCQVEARSIPFGSTEADLFIGLGPRGEKQLLMGAAVVRDHYIELSFSGDKKTITEAEVKLLKGVFAGAQITVDGKPYVPPATTPHP